MSEEEIFKDYNNLDDSVAIFIYKKEIGMLEWELENKQRRLEYFKKRLQERLKGGETK